MTKTRIEAINALAELERMGWKYEPQGDAEVKTPCPVHDDKDPSVSLNVKKNLWTCYSCGAKGDVVSFLAHATGVERQTMLVDLGSRYDLEDQKQINPRVVEKFHSRCGTADRCWPS
jgi:DNA primase